MARKTLAPQQARSRESLRKLLKAAAEVLGQHGVEGATIPRIAQHAGLSPGAVYRRFHDKDALLEAAVLGIMQRQDERIRVALTPAMARQIPLAVFSEQLIHSMLLSYRASAGLLRAIRQFTQGRPHTAFYRKVVKLEFRSYRYLVGLFLVHRTSRGGGERRALGRWRAHPHAVSVVWSWRRPCARHDPDHPYRSGAKYA